MLKKDKAGKVKDTIENKKKLKAKAWDAFSLWVRKRDRCCVTCGYAFWDEQLGEWSVKGLQAGHFHHTVLDFDEMNINAQCNQCNHYKSGNLSKYSVYLIQKHGPDKFMELAMRAKKALAGELRSVNDYQEIIRKYSA